MVTYDHSPKSPYKVILKALVVSIYYSHPPTHTRSSALHTFSQTLCYIIKDLLNCTTSTYSLLFYCTLYTMHTWHAIQVTHPLSWEPRQVATISKPQGREKKRCNHKITVKPDKGSKIGQNLYLHCYAAYSFFSGLDVHINLNLRHGCAYVSCSTY